MSSALVALIQITDVKIEVVTKEAGPDKQAFTLDVNTAVELYHSLNRVLLQGNYITGAHDDHRD